MKKSYINKAFAGLFLTVTLSSCVKDENSPGYEYMPDMYRSPAIEAYVDYGEVRTWIPNDSLKNRLTALQPPYGTIPYTGTEDVWLPYHRLPMKGMDESHGIVTLHYSDSDYNYSVADKNPLKFSKDNVDKGEELYTRFCDHCHGAEGAGDGEVANASGGSIVPPANAFSKPEGQMFYSITYGKGVMGSHASQLSQKERWQLVQYLKVLNNGGEMPTETENAMQPTESNDSNADNAEQEHN